MTFVSSVALYTTDLLKCDFFEMPVLYLLGGASTRNPKQVPVAQLWQRDRASSAISRKRG